MKDQHTVLCFVLCVFWLFFFWQKDESANLGQIELFKVPESPDNGAYFYPGLVTIAL